VPVASLILFLTVPHLNFGVFKRIGQSDRSDTLSAVIELIIPGLIGHLYPCVTFKSCFWNMKEQGYKIQGFRVNIIELAECRYYLFYSIKFFYQLYFMIRYFGNLEIARSPFLPFALSLF